MPRITIDGKIIEAEKGETILKAAERNGIYIPRFCYHPALKISGTCRMCVVEIEKFPKLMTSCSTEVSEGMVIRTDSERVRKARKQILEFLLLNHPLDCPICDQAGECFLQNYYMDWGLYKSRFPLKDKMKKRKRFDAGKHLILDNERCVLCTRCVRFTREITGTNEISVLERGDKSYIEVDEGGINNPYSLNIADICPVGAFTSKDFRFRQRSWFLKRTESICLGCATLCPVEIHHNKGKIYRIVPSQKEHRWLCDEGRLTYHKMDRELRTAIINGNAADLPVALKKGGAIITSSLKDSSVALAGSAHLSIEDNASLAFLARKLLEISDYTFDFVFKQEIEDGISINSDKTPNSRFLRGFARKHGMKMTELNSKLEKGKFGVFICERKTLLQFFPRIDEKTTVISFAFEPPWKTPFKNEIIFPIPSYFQKEGSFMDFKGKIKKTTPCFPASSKNISEYLREMVGGGNKANKEEEQEFITKLLGEL